MFGFYLAGQNPPPLAVELYISVMEKQKLHAGLKEKKILEFVLKNKWSLAMVDSSDALFQPNSIIRKKLFAMLAILEAMPELCDLFLPDKRSSFYIFYVFFAGTRAVIKAIAGSILLKLI